MAPRLAVIAAASALPLALTATSSAATPVADVGHRGASAYAPENTLASFRQAKTRHADYFELDVQQTKDHKLIVMHDATLDRTTNAEKVFPHGSPWRIRDYTLKQVKKLDAGSWFSAKYKGERVPTLGETLRAMDGKGLKLLLEIKNPSLYPGMTARIASALRADPYWLRSGRLIVQSFESSSLKTFHKLLPSVPLGLLGTPTTGQLPAVAKYARYVNPKYTTVTSGYVKKVHQRHMKVFVWIVNDRSTMRRMIGYGVNGIITNRPDTLRSVIRG
ncbi:glycerophosphodiester phosphodiesterase [Actinoallomurus purpureus]|uniref:glycerophosphodiester phosphodiesterase n=1 Tax=Actinoallomurus purpureus TaxID=478114 RepID=UPI0020927889|nr:glycerophosphodiester phosphodiesterase family protein [Actinoallomurus purpureus]MCO6011712.1 glycerophosphodiester phosphodiesterase [Actinoallomurus purpureus]